MQLLACSALRNGATKAWGDTSACWTKESSGCCPVGGSCAEFKFCRQAGEVLHVGYDDGELEVSGLSKAAWAFYSVCLYSVFCPCPDVCDEDLSVEMSFSSHLVSFICSSLRDCFCLSLNLLYYQPFIFLGSLILLLDSLSNKHLSLSLPSDAVSSTFLTFLQVLVENACDVTVVSQLHWLWLVLLVGT